MHKFRAGDIVRHRPSGEKWTLAYSHGGYVAPCGWPPCEAQATDCEMVIAATDEEHRKMLEQWANWPRVVEPGDHRAAICTEQLFMLNEGYIGAGI